MTGEPIEVPGEIAIKVTIGDVCLQWSRLEMALIGLICQIEPIDIEKAFIIFGGLDIQPRVNMAINLGRHNKLPPAILKRIGAVRTKLQNGLAERRNQVVHGAHREIVGAHTTLTMVRWKGAKRNKTLHATDIAALSAEIHELGTEVYSISEELFGRALRAHAQENLGDTLG